MLPHLGGAASTEINWKSIQLRLFQPFIIYLPANSLIVNFG